MRITALPLSFSVCLLCHLQSVKLTYKVTGHHVVCNTSWQRRKSSSTTNIVFDEGTINHLNMFHWENSTSSQSEMLNMFMFSLTDAPKVPSVSLSPSGEIKEGSSVTLTCSSDANPAAKHTWYKGPYQHYEGRQLVFSSIQSSDSGEYYCTAENQLGKKTSEYIFIDVKCEWNSLFKK